MKKLLIVVLLVVLAGGCGYGETWNWDPSRVYNPSDPASVARHNMREREWQEQVNEMNRQREINSLKQDIQELQLKQQQADLEKIREQQ